MSLSARRIHAIRAKACTCMPTSVSFPRRCPGWRSAEAASTWTNAATSKRHVSSEHGFSCTQALLERVTEVQLEVSVARLHKNAHLSTLKCRLHSAAISGSNVPSAALQA